jgi:hypothetical protein
VALFPRSLAALCHADYIVFNGILVRSDSVSRRQDWFVELYETVAAPARASAEVL